MNKMRKLRCMAIVVLALVLAACTTSALKPAKVVVTGLAYACEAGLRPVGTPLPHANVLLYSGPTLVASKTFPLDAPYRYRFAVSPGAYDVKVQLDRHQIYATRGVVLQAGRTVTANFVSTPCW